MYPMYGSKSKSKSIPPTYTDSEKYRKQLYFYIENAFVNINHLCMNFLNKSRQSLFDGSEGFRSAYCLQPQYYSYYFQQQPYQINYLPFGEQQQYYYTDSFSDLQPLNASRVGYQQGWNSFGYGRNETQKDANPKPTRKYKKNKKTPSYSYVPDIILTAPTPPKYPTSPYFLFYKEKKDIIKKQFAEISVTELAAAVAKVWKGLTPKYTAPYTAKHYEYKRIYNQKMKSYKAYLSKYQSQFRKSNSLKKLKNNKLA